MNEKYSICNWIECKSSNIFEASDEHSHVAAVEFRANHRLLAARIGPEEQAKDRMDRNTSRFLRVAGVDCAQTLDGIDAGQTKSKRDSNLISSAEVRILIFKCVCSQIFTSLY